MSSKSNSKKNRGSAEKFFFKWTATTLNAYTNTIKNNYLKILVSHCTRARLGDEEASKNFDFSELGANPRVVKDDREDIRKRLKDAKSRAWTNEEAKTETVLLDTFELKNKQFQAISLVELSALYRLKTLVKMCQELGEMLSRMSTWLDSNTKAFSKVSGMSEVSKFIVKMFESVCGMGEIFCLTSVNWMECKHSKVLNPTKKEYVRTEDERLEITKEPEKYCQQFMSQINYYRTLVYTLACSFEAVLETIFVSINQEKCEVRQREITMILKKLPPQYLFSKNKLKFSERTARLLENPPRNSFIFSIMMDSGDDSKKDSGKVRLESNKSTKKVKSSKYRHGRTNDEKSGKSEKKSEKSLKSDQTQPSDKSKSKSKSKKKSIIDKIVRKGSNSNRSEKK
uniref:FANCI_S4 domain-containing protein n=1 Tax=Caenorhabditis tropicalis TaxID=1561998 RepID=A0A1I7TEC8_9PELO